MRILILIVLALRNAALEIDLNNCTGTMRVCFDGEDEFLAGTRQCYKNKLKTATIRFAPRDWDSVVYHHWLAQIILGEVFQTPTIINDYRKASGTGKTDYYPRPNGWQGNLPDIKMISGPFMNSLENAVNDPFCNSTLSSAIGAPGCAHLSLEIWTDAAIEMPKWPKVANAGFLGLIGQTGWYITSYTPDADPALLSYRGLTDGVKLQTVFKRPLTVNETCARNIAGFSTFCTMFSANTRCVAGSVHAWCSRFLIGASELATLLSVSLNTLPVEVNNNAYAYVAPFLADHVDRQGNPKGFMGSPPCDWTTYDRFQAMQGATGIWPAKINFDIVLEGWGAAVQRRENYLMYDWTPNNDLAKSMYSGPQYALERVSLIPWTANCQNARPSKAQMCLIDANPLSSFNETGCDYGVSIVWKAITKNLNTYSPQTYKFINNMLLTNDVCLSMIALVDFDPVTATRFPNKGIRRQNVVCEWIANNKATWQNWIPLEYRGLRCDDNCNNNGDCVPAADGNPIGDCRCHAGYAGETCTINIIDSLPTNNGVFIRVATFACAFVGIIITILVAKTRGAKNIRVSPETLSTSEKKKLLLELIFRGVIAPSIEIVDIAIDVVNGINLVELSNDDVLASLSFLVTPYIIALAFNLVFSISFLYYQVQTFQQLMTEYQIGKRVFTEDEALSGLNFDRRKARRNLVRLQASVLLALIEDAPFAIMNVIIIFYARKQADYNSILNVVSVLISTAIIGYKLSYIRPILDLIRFIKILDQKHPEKHRIVPLLGANDSIVNTTILSPVSRRLSSLLRANQMSVFAIGKSPATINVMEDGLQASNGTSYDRKRKTINVTDVVTKAQVFTDAEKILRNAQDNDGFNLIVKLFNDTLKQKCENLFRSIPNLDLRAFVSVTFLEILEETVESNLSPEILKEREASLTALAGMLEILLQIQSEKKCL